MKPRKDGKRIEREWARKLKRQTKHREKKTVAVGQQPPVPAGVAHTLGIGR
jgi:hypothetical protein